MKLPFGRAWVKRNWRWFLPSLLLSIAVMFVAVHQIIARSDAVAAAVGYAKANEAIAAQLGPLQSAKLPWFGSAALTVSGERGSAHFTLLLRGDRGSGKLYVEMNKRGIWEPGFARLLFDGGSKLLMDRGRDGGCLSAAPEPGCAIETP